MGRLWRIVKGWWYRLIGKAEKANPRAMLEAEIADFHKATAQYNENLAKQAGMIERLKAQIISEEKKVEMFKARITAAYTAGQTQRAAQLALSHKESTRELGENKQQLQQAEELYKNLVRQRDVYVKDARKRIEKIKSKISKAEMAEAQAKLTEVATATSFDMSGSGASLERLEDSLDERIANAQGKVRVAGESAHLDEFNVTEAEQQALEAQALAEFAAQMGLEAPAGAEPAKPAEASRDLGPVDAAPAAPADPVVVPEKVPEG